MWATIVKWGLIAVAVIGIGYGVYSKGASAGEATGFEKGAASQATVIAQKQATIAELTTSLNKLTTDTNERISTLEQGSQQLAANLLAEKQRKQEVRTEIVTKYVQGNPQVVTNCGWTAPTVNAINQLLEVK